MKIAKKKEELPDPEELSIEDIENGKMRTHCHRCNHKLRRIVRNGTRNLFAVCVNKDCLFFTDLREVKSWCREESSYLPPLLPWEVPGGRYENSH